jgi:hypothetical protein
MMAACLFSSRQAKACSKSSALASRESVGTDNRVNSMGIVLVAGNDAADAQSPHLAMEPEPLLEANIQIEIIGEAELAWCPQNLPLFMQFIERIPGTNCFSVPRRQVGRHISRPLISC